MNIPNKIKIGGHIYTVNYTENLARDRDRIGESCADKLSIDIDKSLPQSMKESVFIHEILEQFNFVYNVGLEHKQIYDLETAIYALVKDNPSVFNEELIQSNICVDAKIDDDIFVDDLVDKATDKFVTELRKTFQDMKR